MSLGGFLLLFVASRLLYVVLIDPSYLSPNLGNEMYVGTIAQELATGPILPFAEYRVNNFMSGTLVMGALAAGFFLLFGPTVFALKLAPLLVFTLALAMWYWTIQRAVSERVALYFALLFCLSPLLFTAYSTATPCCHGESILFSALTVFLLFRMLSDETGSLALPALLGLTAGVGLWFAYIYGLTLLALLGFWVWHDKGRFWQPRVLWFALGFVVGFSPWISINAQIHFAGLVVHGTNVWEHFGLAYLWEGLAHPLTLAPVEFLRTIASDDDWDLYRRAVNLLYSLLYLGPILTAGVLHLQARRSEAAGANYPGRGPRVSTREAGTRPSRTHPTRPTLVGFGVLYLVLFALAVQFSDFRSARYNVPAYPFLFFLTAYSLAYCQDQVPHIARQIQTVFLASVVVLALGTHAPLMSLDRPGYAFSAKGYTYFWMPFTYWETHAPAGSDESEFTLEMARRPFLSDILPKLSCDDKRDLSLALAGLLAAWAPLSGQAEDFSRFERLVPPGFDKHFYYELGVTAMIRHSKELSKAVAEVEFLRHRSPAAYHLALVGIYQQWPRDAALDRSPETLINIPAAVAPEVSPHYWRAIGFLAGQYWYHTDRSLSQLSARLQAFAPRLEPSVQRSFLQGVGELLFIHLSTSPGIAPELERFPRAYQEGLLEGWGMQLGEDELFPLSPWAGLGKFLWMATTKGFSGRSVSYIQQGKAQFEAFFERSAASALEPSLCQ